MRPYILSETNWKNLRNRKVNVAILPWGATEAHNFHLPFGTDNIESDHFAAEAARRVWEHGIDIIVLPTIPIGVNTGQTDILLDLNLMPGTQASILRDIVCTLNGHGIYKLLILNSHGGNDFRQMIRETGREFPGMMLFTCNWYESVERTDYFEFSGDHADEMETGLMLYLAPDLVLPLEEAGDGKARKFSIPDLNEKWAWAERKWSRVTLDTGAGYPKKATAEKGEKYFRVVAGKLARLIRGIAETNREDLYE